MDADSLLTAWAIGAVVAAVLLSAVGNVRRNNYTTPTEVMFLSLMMAVLWPVMIWPTLGIIISASLSDEMKERIRKA